MANCECCFVDFVAKCETNLVIYANLTPAVEYRVVFTFKRSGNMYEVTATAGADGELTVLVSELPAGMLNQYAGDYSIQIYDDAVSNCAPIKFKIAQETDCINFSVSGGTFLKNNIGCLI